MAKDSVTYKGRKGTDCTHGKKFEWRTATLAYLRCEKFRRQWLQDNASGVKSFKIAGNVDGIGAFDDVVIRVVYPQQGKVNTKLVFVQCKHFEDPNKDVMKKLKDLLDSKNVQKYFNSYIAILRILNDKRVHSIQEYYEKLEGKIKMDLKRQKETIERKKEIEQNLQKLFLCSSQDCEFLLYTNLNLESIPEENLNEFQNKDITREIINTVPEIIYETYINKTQLENITNEPVTGVAKEIFVDLKQEFSRRFRIIGNQVEENNKINILSQIIPKADDEGILSLLEDNVKLMTQEPCEAITQYSDLLESVENLHHLETKSKKSQKKFRKIPQYHSLFTEESIENLKNQIINKMSTQVVTSCIEIEKLKVKQTFATQVHESKLLVFINHEKEIHMTCWKEARKSELYKNLKHVVVCFENMNEICDYGKKDNEVFIEIQTSNDINLNSIAEFSEETKYSIKNYAITFQGSKVKVDDIFGDKWDRLIDEETILRILNKDEIIIGSEMLDPPDCYVERNLQCKQLESEKYVAVCSQNMEDESENKATKIFTEDDIISFENTKVFLLTGPAGMGKSTTLRSIAVKYKRKNTSHLVYFIELNKYLNEIKNFKLDCDVSHAIDFLTKKILKLQGLEQSCFANACEEKMNVALFFDAFDEISPDGEKNFAHLIQTLEKSHISRIFVSSRPNFFATLEKIPNSQSINFLPFNASDKEKFLKLYWYQLCKKSAKIKENEHIEHIINSILTSMETRTNGTADDLLGIPLQMKMLAEIYLDKYSEMTADEKSSFTFKTDLYSLYNEFIKKQVDRYLVEKRKMINIQEREKLLALRDEMRGAEELACKLICPRMNVVSATSFEKLKDEIVKMRDHVGLITNIDPPIFLHRTYGEFLTAQYFVNIIRNKADNDFAHIYFCREILIAKKYAFVRRFINVILFNSISGKDNYQLVNTRVKIFFDTDGSTSLHRAASECNTEIVKLLLRNDPSMINVEDDSGQTVLHSACKSGCLETVISILSNIYCQITKENSVQQNPLDLSGKNSSNDIAKLLLEKEQALVRKMDRDGKTALTLACKNNNIEAAICLLKYDPVLANIADNAGHYPIHYASESGNIQIIEELLSLNSNLIHAKNRHGTTLLHVACRNGHIKVVKNLLRKMSSLVNLECDKKNTPLHCAARNGDIKVMKLLLLHDPTLLNKCNSDGRTALHLALKHRKNEAAAYLLNIPEWRVNEGCNPLIFAAEIGDIDIIYKIYQLDKNLLNKVGVKNQTPFLCALKERKHDAAKRLLQLPDCHLVIDSYGTSPLHFASRNGYIDIMEILLQRDRTLLLKLNKFGRSSLCYAIEQNQTEAARFLLSSNEYLTQRDILQSSLKRAIEMKNFNIVKLLIDRDPSLINTSDNCSRSPFDAVCRSPLHAVCEWNNTESVQYLLPLTNSSLILEENTNQSILHIATKHGNLIIMKLILEKFPQLLNMQDSNGKTPLHFACFWNKTEAVKLLLSSEGCRVNISDNQHQYPLHVASEHSNIDIIKMVLEHDNTLLNVQNKEGRTPLHLKLRNYYKSDVFAVTKYFLSLHCSVNVKDVYGQTPFHLSSRIGDVEIMKILLQHDGTLLNQKDNKGRTPLHFACYKGRIKAVKYLLSVCKCDVNVTDNKDNTLLHYAAQYWGDDDYDYDDNDDYDVRKYYVSSLLLQQNRSLLHKKNIKGQTALHIAAKKSQVYAISYLLSHVDNTADVRDVNGDTPLHHCITNGIYNLEYCLKNTIILLRNHDPLVLNVSNNVGQTPLHNAVKIKRFDIVQFLVRCGADVNIKDNYQCTPLDLARKIKNEETSWYDRSEERIIGFLQKEMDGNCCSSENICSSENSCSIYCG